MSTEKKIKEEITEEAKAKSETAVPNHDDFERYKANSYASYISGIVALLLTIVFYSAQYFINGTANYGLCSTIFGMLTAEKIVLYAKRKGRRDLIFAILYALLTLSCTVMTFVAFLK